MKIIAQAIVSGLHLRNSKETRAEAGLLQQMDKKTIAEWSEITGIKQDVIKDRLNKLGWSEQEAVTIPTMRMGGKRWLL